MMSSTTFYSGYQYLEPLFPGSVVNSPTDVVLAVLVIFILALCYKGFKLTQEKLLCRAK